MPVAQDTFIIRRLGQMRPVGARLLVRKYDETGAELAWFWTSYIRFCGEYWTRIEDDDGFILHAQGQLPLFDCAQVGWEQRTVREMREKGLP